MTALKYAPFVGSAGGSGPAGPQGPEGPEGPQGPQGDPGESGGLPAGVIVMWGGLVANIPNGWLLCDGQNGTPDLRDRFVKGAAAGNNPGATGGSATHGHAVTQPADHGALTHSGTAVGTSGAGSSHSHGGPADHASHTHDNHGFTPPDAHTGVINHQHGLSFARGATTGGATTTQGFTSASDTSSTAITDKVDNPAGGVANLPHSNGAVTPTTHAANSGSSLSHGSTGSESSHTHAAGTVTQPSAHAAQSHTGAAVDTVNSEPAYFALAFIQKS